MIVINPSMLSTAVSSKLFDKELKDKIELLLVGFVVTVRFGVCVGVGDGVGLL